MEELLKNIGINKFKNAVYTYKEGEIKFPEIDELLNLTLKIETWELGEGYRYLNFYLKADDLWSTVLTINYKDKTLFDSTKVGAEIGEFISNQYELSFMDGAEEDDSYYFTSEYKRSEELLEYFLLAFRNLEIDYREDKDISITSYVPYKSFNELKTNLEQVVQNLSDPEEVKESAELYMDYHGEDYRAGLYSDISLIHISEFDIMLTEIVEDLMFEYFAEDEILLEE